jgi:hypothetical protein
MLVLLACSTTFAADASAGFWSNLWSRICPNPYVVNN